MKVREKRQVVEWLKRAKEGDLAAREPLFRFYTKRLGAYFNRNLRDPHLAEDLLQETLIVGMQGIERVRDPWCFDAWICRVARNLAVNAFRRKLPLSFDPQVMQELVRVEEKKADPGPDRVQEGAVHRALAALPTREGRAVWEHHGRGVPVKVLAGRHRVSLSGMKMRLLRARRRLRPLLESVLTGKRIVSPYDNPQAEKKEEAWLE